MSQTVDLLSKDQQVLLFAVPCPPRIAPHERFYQEYMNNYIDRLDKFSSSGCEVRVLGATRFGLRTEDYWISQTMLDRRRSGKLMRVSGVRLHDMKCRFWPRDIFQVYGNIVLSNPNFVKKTEEIIELLYGKDNGIEVVPSRFGEGGLVLRDDKLIIASDKLIKDDSLVNIINEGFYVNFVPSPVDNEMGLRSDELFSWTDHIDCIINGGLTPGGNVFSVASKLYYDTYRDQIDDTMKNFDGELRTVKHKSTDVYARGINFMKLPNGKIMIPKRCDEVKAHLEYFIGKENVLVTDTNFSIDYSGPGGGYRCMSNLIQWH